MLGDSINSRKAFSASCWLWKLFSLQKVVKMLEEVVVGERSTECGGWGPIYSISEVLVVQRAVRHCGEDWALSVDQCQPAAGTAVFGASHKSAEHTSQMYWFYCTQKAVVDQMGSRPPNSDYDFFGVQVWLWEVLWSCFSVQPLSWSSLVAYKILFVVCHNPVEKWFTVVAQNKRRQHFKMMIVFWFSVSSWRTHLLSFFTVPISNAEWL